ncbi:MAG TPA: polymer-forming cytoskeletal protein [Chloroflexia bacterium]|jgi:hypothetical protein
MQVLHGQVTEDITLEEDLRLHGMVVGSVTVSPNVTLELNGYVTENVIVLPGARVELHGRVGGNVRNTGGRLKVWGVIDGLLMREAGDTIVYSGARVRFGGDKVEKLVIDGLEFRPYDYLEEETKEVVRIEAKLRLSEDEYQELRKLQFQGAIKNEYVPVVRVGVSDAPVEMRFGTGYWSKHEDFYKCHILLLPRSYDDEPPKERPDLIDDLLGLEWALTIQMGIMDALLEQLVAKGVLTMEEVEQFKETAKSQQWWKVQELYKIKDLDDALNLSMNGSRIEASNPD